MATSSNSKRFLLRGDIPFLPEDGSTPFDTRKISQSDVLIFGTSCGDGENIWGGGEHPGNLNGSRCNSSSTEARVLVAITDHGPTPPEIGTYSHLSGNRAPPLIYPQGKREPAYLSVGFSSLKLALPWA
ncbi:hypothetical protein AVEN_159723-1 [Araneus ventricosus]|uniref:Uncharacterized protein n=1 Tax=Araneus ventricosus TaxID=182803 RepID=A0A4Y2JTS7_ARAVE|nr:hypothetical protein AVEN_159723-1 [Araneus ventricosus]